VANKIIDFVNSIWQ